ncbi:MAG: DUF2956 domain-containing protein [Gammaproteobacteria bacterium]
MSKFPKKNKLSDKTKDEALKIARATQKPGQTKEQTKLITQGIQKGIEQYKNKQKEKTRELDKKLKKYTANIDSPESLADNVLEPEAVKNTKLPWVLLILSWIGFTAYIVLRS